jgi:hypothetical protein
MNRSLRLLQTALIQCLHRREVKDSAPKELSRSSAQRAMPGSIDPASLVFNAPALDDHLRAEFYG